MTTVRVAQLEVTAQETFWSAIDLQLAVMPRICEALGRPIGRGRILAKPDLAILIYPILAKPNLAKIGVVVCWPTCET